MMIVTVHRSELFQILQKNNNQRKHMIREGRGIQPQLVQLSLMTAYSSPVSATRVENMGIKKTPDKVQNLGFKP